MVGYRGHIYTHHFMGMSEGRWAKRFVLVSLVSWAGQVSMLEVRLFLLFGVREGMEILKHVADCEISQNVFACLYVNQ